MNKGQKVAKMVRFMVNEIPDPNEPVIRLFFSEGDTISTFPPYAYTATYGSEPAVVEEIIFERIDIRGVSRGEKFLRSLFVNREEAENAFCISNWLIEERVKERTESLENKYKNRIEWLENRCTALLARLKGRDSKIKKMKSFRDRVVNTFDRIIRCLRK